MAYRALFSLAVVGFVACGGAAPMTPAPSTFAVTGVVTDTAPSHRPLSGVTLTIVDGPWAGYATSTNHNGEFVFSGINGALTLRASSNGYSSESIGVEMTAARNVRIALHPEPTVIVETFTRATSQAGACDTPCRVYTLEIHNDGMVEATMTWPTFGVGLRLSLWRGDTLIATSLPAGTLRQAFHDPAAVSGGVAYQLRVSGYSGAEAPDFTVGLRRPN